MKNSPVKIPSCSECDNKNIFGCLPLHEIEKLSVNKDNNFFKKGQVIFYEGNHPHGMYCIYNGKVKISKLGDEGKEQIVRFAGEGELLGYRSALSNESYKATATAMEDCYICHIPKEKFSEVLNNNSNFSLEIIRLLSDDLKKSEQNLLNISQKPVRERIAETLLVLKNRFGFEKDGKTLTIVLTRREIGDIAGTTTETTIRTLSEFVKEGSIKLSGKKILILNLNKLLLAANVHD
ncbi:MAG: Crp/Fnr family transcriptional regulator [Flavobacteriales bacterium CG_4_9_14_3_um_filter_32_8]|nr:MAG: Crp/Fnr family transcriptional regulator [Flavobacteriales bacterium CG_4_9_14_3_um_filter_32_8]